MRKLYPIAIFMVFCTISMLIPNILAAESVSKPTVTLPSGWYLDEDDPYPNADVGEYDPAGCGLLTYWHGEDSVYIWYESALGTSWTASALEDEAYEIHEWYWEGYPIYNTGVWTVADTSAGYAIGWDEEAYTDSLIAVLAKNDVLVLVTALYDWDSEDEVMNIVNSLDVPSDSIGGSSTGFIVVGLVAAVAVIVAVVFLRKRKPKEEPKRTTVKFEPVMIHTS